VKVAASPYNSMEDIWFYIMEEAKETRKAICQTTEWKGEL
jgi:hypothetical protein